MATAYPGALDATNNQLRTDIAQTDDLDASGKEHDVMHVNVNGAVFELETKLGTGVSTASSGAVMMGTGSRNFPLRHSGRRSRLGFLSGISDNNGD